MGAMKWTAAAAAAILVEILKSQVSARSENYPMTVGNPCNAESNKTNPASSGEG